MSTVHTVFLASDFYGVFIYMGLFPVILFATFVALWALYCRCHRTALVSAIIGCMPTIKVLSDIVVRHNLGDSWTLGVSLVMVALALLAVGITSHRRIIKDREGR